MKIFSYPTVSAPEWNGGRVVCSFGRHSMQQGRVLHRHTSLNSTKHRHQEAAHSLKHNFVQITLRLTLWCRGCLLEGHTERLCCTAASITAAAGVVGIVISVAAAAAAAAVMAAATAGRAVVATHPVLTFDCPERK